MQEAGDHRFMGEQCGAAHAKNQRKFAKPKTGDDALKSLEENYLVWEGAAHDEGGVSHGTAEVNEAARGQEDDVFAVGELVTVDLRLDVGLVDAVVIQPLKWGLTDWSILKEISVVHDRSYIVQSRLWRL